MLERMALVNLNEQKMLCDQCHDHDEQYVLKPVYTSPESVCAKVIHLMHLVRQPWTLLCDMRWDEYITLETKCEEDKKTILARGCYLYLVYVKGHEMEKCPQVIDSTFSFVCCFYAILTLMKSKNPTTVDKGLELCRHVTNKLHPFSLHYNKLTYDLTAVNQISKEFNEEPVLEVLETAISIAVHCPSRTLRQRGIQFVTKFLDKFAWLDRAHLLQRLLFTTQHYGVKGYLSGYFKDKLSVILQESSPPNCAPFISNPRFSAILDQILILSNGSESDLLQEHDLVMSGLNLLRFLLIRDSKHQTCIWNRMKKIEENYISPLRTGLNLSRMHYKEELRKIMNPKKETPSSAFALNGIDLPSIPVKERKQVIESAIHSFDMMQGVCSRVQQLIDEKT